MEIKEVKQQEFLAKTGLDQAADPVQAEKDLLTGLLKAAEYKTEKTAVYEVVRGGEKLFGVKVHPISDDDIAKARKKATTFRDNPQNRKLAPIEVAFDEALQISWLVYLATVEEDRQKIWGNPAFMNKHNLLQPVESIDVLLTAGEKRELLALINDLSDSESSAEISLEEAAKN